MKTSARSGSTDRICWRNGLMRLWPLISLELITESQIKRAMFTRRPKVFLLLFGCLFQTNISHGNNGKTKDLLRDSGSSETKKQNMMTNFNQRRNQEKYASMSTGRKNNTKMGIHRSVVKLSRNEIIHTRSHNGRLMQGIRRRQVSFGVSRL